MNRCYSCSHLDGDEYSVWCGLGISYQPTLCRKYRSKWMERFRLVVWLVLLIVLIIIFANGGTP